MIRPREIAARATKPLSALLAVAAGAGVAVAVAAGGSAELGQTTTAPVYGAEAPVVQYSTTPGSKPYTTPAGILTRWRYHSSPDTPAGTVRLELFRPGTGLGVYEAVAASDAKPLAPDSGFEFRERIAVERGWVLGLDPGADAEVGITVPAATDQMFQFSSDVPVGDTSTATGPFPTYRVNVAATVEPDADGDEYGDRSQDGCPTQAATHRACSNRFSLGPLRRSRANGTASIAVKVPGPGRLSLRGKRVVGGHKVVRASKRSFSAGATTKLAIKSKGKADRKLDRDGWVRVRIRVAFTPTGGIRRTKPMTVTLIQR